jgi:PhzF family phenazine biosynthesis protein
MPLRWFTPKVEVDLCGHATLATAHVLFRYSFPAAEKLTFSTRSGDLAVTRDGELLTLDFPARRGKPLEITDALVSALGVRPREAYLARDVLAVFASESEVRDFKPDFQRLSALDAFAVIITAPGDACDYVCRFFAPRKGIPEDPVTGSASCTLVPYWAARLGKSQLTARQLSERGGELRCTLRDERVLIAGRTVEYLRGEIDIHFSTSA